MNKKERKKVRKSIVQGLKYQEEARETYDRECKRLEALHQERLALAYDIFNNTMADVGYSLAFIEMKYSKDEYPELWI